MAKPKRLAGGRGKLTGLFRKPKRLAKAGRRFGGLPAAALLTAVLTGAVLVGATAAWFAAPAHKLATLVNVQPPTDIDIFEPDGKTPLAMDLNYSAADKTTGGGAATVTVRRIFCVRSSGDYKLEIAHTTNLKNLQFKLFEAETVTDGSGNITDDGVSCKFDGNAPLALTTLNRVDGTDGFYQADGQYKNWNYGQYDSVQDHAQPVYHVTDKRDYRVGTLDYYVIEISWTEVEEKETDLIYLLATLA